MADSVIKRDNGIILALEKYYCESETDITNAIKDMVVPDEYRTMHWAYLQIGAVGLSLAGGQWLTLVAQVNSSYYLVVACIYDVTGIAIKARSCIGGSMTSWATIAQHYAENILATSTIKSGYMNAVQLSSSLTDVTSGGVVPTSPNALGFKFVVIVFINSATDGSGARGVLVLPTKTASYYAYYAVCVGGQSGHVRIAVSGGELQIVSQSGFSTLKVLYVFGVN